MRSARFITLAVTALALAGCMQSGGSGIFARNAPPLAQNHVVLPDMLRPGLRRTVAQPVMAQPAVVAQPLGGQQMMPQQLVAQPVALEAPDPAYRSTPATSCASWCSARKA